MASYLTEEDLRRAVRRLQTSRADPRLVDFLILKRGIALSSGERVELSALEPAFKQAVEEFNRRDGVGAEDVVWFNPFGTGRTVELGYRLDPLSNGPNVTVPRWTDIVDVVERKRARVVKLKSGYDMILEGRMLGRAPVPPRTEPMKPYLADAAIWFYRTTDLESVVEGELTMNAMCDAFKAAVGLTPAEVEAVFLTGAPPEQPAEASGAA